jgi:drug/metabolite transporter (DMT)-like permease
MRPPSRTVGITAAVVTVLVWTSFIVIARASAQRTLNPFDLAYLRILGAAVVLLPWGAWMVRRRGLQGWLGVSPLPVRLTALLGFFGGFLYALLAYAGFFFAPAAHGSVLMPGSLPLWTTLLAMLLLGERISSTRGIGVGFIVAGGLLVGGGSLLQAFSGGSGMWRGDLLFMCASFCWATYTVLARKYALDAVQATIAIITFAFVVYVPAYTALVLLDAVPSQLLRAPTGEIVFQLIFQGLGSVVISGITFTTMVQYFGPVRSTMITAFVPGMSALGAVIFLGEPLYWNLLAGLALATVGILFGVRASRGNGSAEAIPTADGARP